MRCFRSESCRGHNHFRVRRFTSSSSSSSYSRSRCRCRCHRRRFFNNSFSRSRRNSRFSCSHFRSFSR